MPTFEELFELLKSLKVADGDSVDATEIVNGLSENLSNLKEGFKATVDAKNSEIEVKKAEIAELQTHNYKLMMGAKNQSSHDTMGGKEHEDEKLEEQGVSSLFTFERVNH